MIELHPAHMWFGGRGRSQARVLLVVRPEQMVPICLDKSPHCHN